MESAHAEDHRFVGNSLIAMPEVKTSWPHFVSITWRKRVCIVESGILEVKRTNRLFICVGGRGSCQFSKFGDGPSARAWVVGACRASDGIGKDGLRS